MKRPATNKINGDGVDFLAGFYDPPLRRYGSPGRNPFRRAKAAAWGEALREWLEGRRAEATRGDYRRAMASLLSFCRRPPWQVRQADAARWLEVGLVIFDRPRYLVVVSIHPRI